MLNLHKLGLNRIPLFAALISTLVTPFVNADTLAPKTNFVGWYLGGNLGYSLASVSGSSIVMAETTLIPQDQATTNKAAAAANIGLIGGAQFAIPHNQATPWFNHYRVGVRYQYQAAQKLSGHGNWNNSPDVYTYSFNAQTQMLLLDSALALYDSHGWEPYLHLGVGFNMTTATSYSQSATSFYPGLQSYNFSNRTSSGFIGVFGLGIEYAVYKNWRAVLSYDYFTPVTAQLGNGTPLEFGTPAAPKATLGNQAVNLGLRYQF